MEIDSKLCGTNLLSRAQKYHQAEDAGSTECSNENKMLPLIARSDSLWLSSRFSIKIILSRRNIEKEVIVAVFKTQNLRERARV